MLCCLADGFGSDEDRALGGDDGIYADAVGAFPSHEDHQSGLYEPLPGTGHSDGDGLGTYDFEEDEHAAAGYLDVGASAEGEDDAAGGEAAPDGDDLPVDGGYGWVPGATGQEAASDYLAVDGEPDEDDAPSGFGWEDDDGVDE